MQTVTRADSKPAWRDCWQSSVNLGHYRTLIVLFTAQCFAQTAMPMMVLVSGIIGAAMAPSMSLSTLPLAIAVVGLATTTVPASLMMQRFGRKSGFLTAVGYAVLAALLAAWSLYLQSFMLFCAASFLIGSFTAFLQQFRFAVAESVPVETIARSLSILMLAGIVAAWLGPEVATRFSDVEGLPLYAGTFVAMAGLLSIAFLILLVFYRNTEPQSLQATGEPRALGEILAQPDMGLAIAAAAIGFGVMTLVMTATPVSMHELDHHSLEDTAWVIQSHIMAMYIPSLFSGLLIGWFGVRRIIMAGLVVMVAVVIVGHGSPHLMHYWWSMVLLGVGWNFLFIGGTTLLTQTHRAEERFRVQATNDFLVFGLQAVGSLGAGVLLASLGWNAIMLLSLPLLLLLLPFLWRARSAAGLPA